MGDVNYGRIAREVGKGVLARGRRPSARSKGVSFVFYASGYSGYGPSLKGRKKEIKDYSVNLDWLPMTPDFKGTAVMTRWPNRKVHAVSSVKSFFRALYKSSGKIARIVIIGHGNGKQFGFSGKRISGPGAVQLGSVLDSGVLKAQAAMLKKIRARVLPKATFDYVSCGSTAIKAFLQDIADAFNMTARGFNHQLLWLLDYDSKKYKIKQRGEIVDPGSSVARTMGAVAVVRGAHKLPFNVTAAPPKPNTP